MNKNDKRINPIGCFPQLAKLCGCNNLTFVELDFFNVFSTTEICRLVRDRHFRWRICASEGEIGDRSVRHRHRVFDHTLRCKWQQPRAQRYHANGATGTDQYGRSSSEWGRKVPVLPWRGSYCWSFQGDYKSVIFSDLSSVWFNLRDKTLRDFQKKKEFFKIY